MTPLEEPSSGSRVCDRYMPFTLYEWIGCHSADMIARLIWVKLLQETEGGVQAAL